MNKENIYNDIQKATESLIGMAKDLCFNNISNNYFYIISEIRNNESNAFARNKIRIKENSLKTPKPLAEILSELEELYPNFYDIYLYVYKAYKNKTVIEIQYFPRSALSYDYRLETQSKETMLHSKVVLPPYYTETKKKFDIHWEFVPVNHKWKMFWWKRKQEKYFKSRGHKI